MAKKIIILLVLLTIAAFAFWLIFGAPKHPVAIIKVIDTAGKPIAGAIIKPDGLRPKKNGGHYSWTDAMPVKPTAVKTDANGIAHISYPHYVVERLETGEISFRVDHPDFCPDRPFRTVAAAPPANAKLLDRAKFIFAVATRRVVTRPDPVVLKRGAILKVAGYFDSKENRVTNIYPQVSTDWLYGRKDWTQTSDGYLITRRISEGSNAFRLASFPTNGSPLFSDIQTFNAVPGQTNEFFLKLGPGISLHGSLDNSAPRPIKNGKVEIQIFSNDINPPNRSYLQWTAWRPITPDGAFTFESLPTGHTEVVVLCDGFISTNGTNSQASMSSPQTFELTKRENQITIGMQPTATCEIKVLDDLGHPLPGAEVVFWPNVLWNNWGSTVFMNYLYNSEDLLQKTEIDWVKISTKLPRPFQGLTGTNGVVILSNLPPFNQPFSASSTNYEMPVLTNNWSDGERAIQVILKPGETTSATVRMQKKGTEFIHHRK